MALFTFVEEVADESAIKARPGTATVPIAEFLAPVASLLKNADARKSDTSIKRTQVRVPLGMKNAPIYAVAGAAVGAFTKLNADRPEADRYHTAAVLRCICSQYRPAGERVTESKKNPGVKITKPVTEREASVTFYIDPTMLNKDLVHYHGAAYRKYRADNAALEAASNGTLAALEDKQSVTLTDATTERKPAEQNTAETKQPASQKIATKRAS
jgi:hypothetical protein